MADILRITTPLLDKNAIPASKPVADPNAPFNLADVSRVIQAGQGSEILKQNTQLNESESPNILMDMLKDPSVTTGFLKNILLLEEFFQLLPVNNNTLTQEIEQLFQTLWVKPDGILDEMLMQETASTSYKGELFDTLRQLLSQSSSPELRYSVANLLKSINATFYQKDILQSLSNTLFYIAENIKPDQALAGRFMVLSRGFAAQGAAQQFPQLKDAVLAALKDLQGSILFTPQLEKMAPMVIYNLSRFIDNPDFIPEAVRNLLTFVEGSEPKTQLIQLVQQTLEEGLQNEDNSKVMETLTRIIQRQTGDTDVRLLGADKLDRIIHSLLSSPCNFTPLLHFIIPVQEGETKAFAEMWIDPDANNDPPDKENRERQVHMLIVFDVTGIGRLEAELFLRGKNIALSLFCPQDYVRQFSQLSNTVSRAMMATDYRVTDVKVDKLERERSLMEVFKTLPHKRTGVNVTA